MGVELEPSTPIETCSHIVHVICCGDIRAMVLQTPVGLQVSMELKALMNRADLRDVASAANQAYDWIFHTQADFGPLLAQNAISRVRKNED